MDTVTASVDNCSKTIKDCCLSGPTEIVDEHDPNGEDAREELREEEGLLVASIILLCHNLASKDARPVNYFIQYAGLILETIHIKPD